MDILATHLLSSKASHGGISQREYNEKFLLKTRSQTKREPGNVILQEDSNVQKFFPALSDADKPTLAGDSVEEEEEEEGCSKFQSSLPQFRTFINSLGARNQGREKQTKKLGGGFPALEKLLLMDISTEEGILKGAVQFSTTI